MNRKPNRKRKIIIFLFVILNLYGLLCGVLYFFQENLIFLPTVLPQNYEFRMEYPFKEITLNTQDGAKLNGLHFKVENRRGVILYFHGNAGDLQRWGEIVSFFVKKNYDVVAMDYRGYGKSTGKKSMQALYNDAQLWYNYVAGIYSEEQIRVYGRSLGTTFATFVASKNHPKKLILESPFYSVLDVGKSRFPFLPVKSLLRYTFPTYQYSNDVTCPITIYHGTEDSVINFSQGKKLFDFIKQTNKQFIPITGGNHNDLVQFPDYLNTIDAVLEK